MLTTLPFECVPDRECANRNGAAWNPFDTASFDGLGCFAACQALREDSLLWLNGAAAGQVWQTVAGKDESIKAVFARILEAIDAWTEPEGEFE
jgi:3-methyladenine DNA glycosylase Tag